LALDRHIDVKRNKKLMRIVYIYSKHICVRKVLVNL